MANFRAYKSPTTLLKTWQKIRLKKGEPTHEQIEHLEANCSTVFGAQPIVAVIFRFFFRFFFPLRTSLIQPTSISWTSLSEVHPPTTQAGFHLWRGSPFGIRSSLVRVSDLEPYIKLLSTKFTRNNVARITTIFFFFFFVGAKKI